MELLLLGIVGASTPTAALDAWVGEQWEPALSRAPVVLHHTTYRLALQDPDTSLQIDHMTLAEIADAASAQAIDELVATLRLSISGSFAAPSVLAWRFTQIAPQVWAEPGAGGRADGVLLVANNAADGATAAFHQWYDRVHIADTFATLGTIGARRFEWRPAAGGDLCAHRFLVCYDVPAGDIEAAEDRRLALAAERVASSARGEEPSVPVPDFIRGPRYASWFAARSPRA